MGNCSGRAYKRKGVAWILCRHHWYQLIAILHMVDHPHEIEEFA